MVSQLLSLSEPCNGDVMASEARPLLNLARLSQVQRRQIHPTMALQLLLLGEPSNGDAMAGGAWPRPTTSKSDSHSSAGPSGPPALSSSERRRAGGGWRKKMEENQKEKKKKNQNIKVLLKNAPSALVDIHVSTGWPKLAGWTKLIKMQKV